MNNNLSFFFIFLITTTIWSSLSIAQNQSNWSCSNNNVSHEHEEVKVTINTDGTPCPSSLLLNNPADNGWQTPSQFLGYHPENKTCAYSFPGADKDISGYPQQLTVMCQRKEIK